MSNRTTQLKSFVITLILISVFVTHPNRQVNAMVQPLGGYITGTVISSGRPVPSVLVIINQGGSERGRSLTGDDGKYYIDNLDVGSYELVATRGNRQVIHQVTLPNDRVHDIPF